MNHQHTRHTLTATFAAVAALMAACGGGSNDPPTPAPPPPAAQTVTIGGIAADGPLQGVTACYDLNDNGACDSGEPVSEASGADGAFSIEVDAAVAGQHRVVVDVPATAIDADSGEEVGAAFTMQTPATGTTDAHEVFVSPLTTLVQAHIDASDATLEEAAAFVQTQAGLAMSPLDNFLQTDDEASAHANFAARLILLTQLQQAQALAALVGEDDVAGNPIDQADIDAAIREAALAALPTIGARASDLAMLEQSEPDAVQQALADAADALVADAGLTADSAPVLIGLDDLPANTASEPEAEASLRALTFSDPNTWFYRTLLSTEEDATPDDDGMVRYYDRRSQSVVDASGNPVVSTWGFGSSPAREADPHWNGSAWVNCPLGTRGEATERDADGANEYNYCDGYELGTSVRKDLDIGGQTLRSVIETRVRTLPGGANGVAFASWGPSNLDLLGSATFPADSTLSYQTNEATSAAPAYDATSAGILNVYAASVAAGGDARSTSGLACAGDLTGLSGPVATLEEMAARNPGTPCIFGATTDANGSSGERNEWWSNSTLHVATVPGAATPPAGTGNFYTTNAVVRVAFGSGNATTYYRCLERSSTKSPRNCEPAGTGSYTIETLGDARVMSFSGLPALHADAGFTRVFVERDGVVRYGYKSVVGKPTQLIAFNLTAANAIFEQLGLPPLVPQ